MLTRGVPARCALCRLASPFARPGPRCSRVAAGRPAIRPYPSAAPVATPSNRHSTPRMPGSWSRAATKCISEVPGLLKQVSTPQAVSVRISAWAPFTGSSLSRAHGDGDSSPAAHSAMHAAAGGPAWDSGHPPRPLLSRHARSLRVTGRWLIEITSTQGAYLEAILPVGHELITDPVTDSLQWERGHEQGPHHRAGHDPARAHSH